jgi:membrane-bound inhibitor of C-type lysozyme
MAQEIPKLQVSFSTEGKQVKAVFTCAKAEGAQIAKVESAIRSLSREMVTDKEKGTVNATFAMDTKFVTALEALSGSGALFRLVPSKTDIKRALKQGVAIQPGA